ncbi:MAG: hypothetical protein K2X77_14255 [Candidatus Obscuribacterales bacterium]|jgi:hypothetical protein|nr:hypothetical protein [Candidatus Obscuribacterales bacterium]
MKKRRCKSNPGNVFVNLDRPLPAHLKLKLGQNIAIVRDVSSAGENIVRSLIMSDPLVQDDKVSSGLHIPGQPADTFVVGLGAALKEGSGEITIRLGPPSNKLLRLSFSVCCS